MTPEDFRRIALSLPEAVEQAHMGHPDFRVRGKIFATLGAPDHDSGMVKLTLEQQEAFVESYPDVFRPVKGGWGRRGATNVCLTKATVRSLRPALFCAWENVAPASLTRVATDSKGSSGPGRRKSRRAGR